MTGTAWLVVLDQLRTLHAKQLLSAAAAADAVILHTGWNFIS
jgi:hypothetical protein